MAVEAPWRAPSAYALDRSRALRQERHGLPAFQVHEDRARGMPFPQGEIVYPQHSGRGQGGQWPPAQTAQQGVPAHHQVPLVAQTHPGFASQGHAEGHETLGEPQRTPCPGGRDGGQPFGEDAAVTGAIAAKPLPHA